MNPKDNKIPFRKVIEAIQTDRPNLDNIRQKNNNLINKTINIKPGQIAENARQLALILIPYIYQRQGQLVKIQKLESVHKCNKYEISEGTTIISFVNEKILQSMANRHANFEKYDARKNKYMPTDCPLPLVTQLANYQDEWPFNYLEGIILSPIIRADGSILNQPGYDKTTRLYAAMNNKNPVIIPDNLDKKAAIHALTYLKNFISEFPFKTATDRAVALAMLLTTAIRKSIDHAPLFAISAPCPGTGKSTLADITNIITTGDPANAFNYIPDEDEFRKSLFATLLTSPPVILIDNATGIINSPTLNIMLSQKSYGDRFLGESKTGTVSTNTIFIMTGNNLTLSRDMIRRTLFCMLDANKEKPSNREFKTDIYSYAWQEREAITKAILTILKAYHDAGYPVSDTLPKMNGYNDWSKWVRGALVWLDEADPIESQMTLEERDPIKSINAAIFAALYEVYGNREFLVKDILREINTNSELNEALQDGISGRQGINNRSLGNWLSKNCDQIYESRKLVKNNSYRRAIVWKLEQV